MAQQSPSLAFFDDANTSKEFSIDPPDLIGTSSGGELSARSTRL